MAEEQATGHKPQATPALKAALAFLKSRDRFAAEIRAHLLAKGFDEAIAEEAVADLIERKLINDCNTAERHIERNSGKRGVGSEKLRAELQKLGAPEDIIAAKLQLLEGGEAERALQALRAKYKSGAERAKAGRFLFGRGFSEETIESVLDAFCTTEE
jgi:SOS response regulatory protein OraA/RecX